MRDLEGAGASFFVQTNTHDGQQKAGCEAAMLMVLGTPRGWNGRETSDFQAVGAAARDGHPVREARDLPTSAETQDDDQYVVRTATGSDCGTAAEQYARLLRASGGERAEARLGQAVIRRQMSRKRPRGCRTAGRRASRASSRPWGRPARRGRP